ncbi:MAG: glycogen/starch/alpha-glucan phosphorylase [Polyangiales bacterium]
MRVEDDRTGMHPATLERAVVDHLYYTCGRETFSASVRDVYFAVAHAARDRLVHRWRATQKAYYESDAKRVYYLSAEFLLGRQLPRNLICLGQYDVAARLLKQYGIELGELIEHEHDPGLGNGGLGRLAACYLESMATMQIPAVGYGIRYEYGIFEQRIVDGRQLEAADAWLRHGNPWEMARHEYSVPVYMYGHVEEGTDDEGHYRPRWVDTRKVIGVPYDIPIAGYGNDTVNTLRLWSARATKEFDLEVFNDGDYRRAVEEKAVTESISKVLYPKDESPEGRELRLKQQYFFVACSVADILRRFAKSHGTDFDALPDKAAIQLNDTHPSIAVAELMRVLVDQHDLPWDRAWDITRRAVAFTNHTLLPEALEKWPLETFDRMLPRHAQIIREIDRRFLQEVHVHAPFDEERKRRLAIVEQGASPQVRMAHLAVVGSHKVNGVAELHSKLLRERVMPDFAEMWPERFGNVTNGVTPRRWLLVANPGLSHAITERIGREWITDLSELARLEDHAEDAAFRDELAAIKRQNKERLGQVIEERTGVRIDPRSMFDSQVKRIHEYKRQLLNLLHVVAHYRALRSDPQLDRVPRTVLFAGKAAPGYTTAKLHIKLINDVAATVNADPAVRDRLRVVFVPNYSVSLAELIIPATDLSEQISLAGKEASGTGNMKLMMNGALTIGTLDGANIEIRRAVGDDAFFLFGLDADRVHAQRAEGYDPAVSIRKSPRLADAIDAIGSGLFSPEEPDRYRSVVESLRHHDPYMVCADFDDYVACQERVDRTFEDRDEWMRRIVRNIAASGRFSSDRSIRGYLDDIWHAQPVPVSLEERASWAPRWDAPRPSEAPPRGE